MIKRDIRKLYLDKRKSIDTENLSKKIIENIVNFKDIFVFENYHVFLTIKDKNEINTELIINILREQNKNIIIPKSNFEDGSMNSYLYDKDVVLEKNSYKIFEPVKGKIVDDKIIDVIFIPLLAFDERGYRVGYGKGFYDRFLEKCRDDILKIGVSFFEPEKNISDINEFDKKLDYCITPYRVHKFFEK